MLNDEDHSLYSISFSSLETLGDSVIENYLNKNNIRPEMWLIEKTPLSSAYVTKPEQYSN